MLKDKQGMKHWTESTDNESTSAKLTSATDDNEEEDWGAAMQVDVCGDLKNHPMKGKLGTSHKAKEARPNKTGEEKIPLTCCGCKEVVKHCSQFLLLHEGEGNVETWAGGHWGHCFSCSRFNKQEWLDEAEEADARKRFVSFAKNKVLACNDSALQGHCHPCTERHMDWL